jgi:hypothetical protein
MMATFTAVATPHALVVLTVSHDVLFRQPPSCAALKPPFLSTELRCALNVISNDSHSKRTVIPNDYVACTI